MTALLGIAAVANAQGEIVTDVYGGAEAYAGMSGSYDVDASGAYGTAEDLGADVRARVSATLYDALEREDQVRADLREDIDASEENEPETDTDVASRLDVLERVDVSHNDRVEKDIEAETGPVNAGADAGAWGSFAGFFRGIGHAIGGLVDGITGALTVESDAHGGVDDQLDAAQGVETDVRATLDEALATDIAVPPIEPSLSGDHELDSATKIAGGGEGLVGLGLG